MSKNRNKVNISKISLEIDGKVIELTLQQAKQLKDILNDTFGVERTIYRDNYIYPTRPWWNNPISFQAKSSTSFPVSVSDNIARYETDEWKGELTTSTLTLKAA